MKSSSPEQTESERRGNSIKTQALIPACVAVVTSQFEYQHNFRSNPPAEWNPVKNMVSTAGSQCLSALQS